MCFSICRRRINGPCLLVWSGRSLADVAAFNERLDAIPDSSCDFVYLDGAHDYANVKLEMTPYWRKVRWLRDRTSVASTPQDTTRKPHAVRVVSPACSLC